MKRPIFLAILSLVGFCRAEMAPEAIQLNERKESGRITIQARNTDMSLQRWIQVQLAGANNVGADRGLPVRAMLQPGEMRDLLVIRVNDPSRGASYQIESQQGFGNPDAQPDASVAYLLPWEHGQKHAVGQGYLGQATHQGLYALDFEMPEGTTICAARDGVVASLKQDSDMGGASPAYARLGNYIDLLHSDGTWSTYAHLQNRGGLVREGDRVKAGDPIALSGQTGQATGPHLHFSVQKARWDALPETFATSFQMDANQVGFIEEGKYYYSWHPNMPDFERVDASKIDEASLEADVKPASGSKVSFREQKVDNRALFYCSNPWARAIELTVDFAASRNVEPSKPLPLVKVVPAKSEVFLLSVLMKGDSSYQTSYKYRPLP